MQIKIQIRKIQQPDLKQIAQLFDAYRQFYEEPADLTLAERYLERRMKNNDSEILVAENEQGRLDGFCQMYPTFCSVLAQPIYVLYDLFVAPAARGNGVAKQLLDGAVMVGRENGMARLDLSTAKNNLHAQSVYEAHGWIRDNDFFTYSYAL